MSRFQFVADHRDTFEVKWLCELVEVARSSFYAWLAAAAARAAPAAADDALARADPARCTPRTTRPTGRRGSPPSSTTAPRRRRRAGQPQAGRPGDARSTASPGYRLRRKVRTTVPEPADTPVPDLLKRDFTAAGAEHQVRRRHHLPAAGHGGNLYLATVIDCCSRRLAGWSIAEHMRTELVADALQRRRAADAAAWPARSSTPITGPSTPPRTTPSSARSSASPSRWARSAPAPTTPWPSRSTRPSNARPCTAPPAGTTAATRRRAVFNWITRYNTRRRHSYCGQLSPDHLRERPPRRYAATGRVNIKSRVHFSGRRPGRARHRVHRRSSVARRPEDPRQR